MASVAEADEPDEDDDDDAPLANEPATVNRAPSFYYTDLDLLVSRLDEGNDEGIDYEVRGSAECSWSLCCVRPRAMS